MGATISRLVWFQWLLSNWKNRREGGGELLREVHGYCCYYDWLCRGSGLKDWFGEQNIREGTNKEDDHDDDDGAMMR